MDFKNATPEQLNELHFQFVSRGNLTAARMVGYYQTHYNHSVKVVKGRKVPIGTTGVVFHIGSYCRSKYGDPWGIYTTYSVGIRDVSGKVHWTNIDNVELIED